MNDIHKEQVSSLLDSELAAVEADELIKAFENDNGLNQQFDRYALIRDALNEDVVIHQTSFLKGVQDALAVEPTVLAPTPKKRENKTYVTLALAASVAIFAVAIFDIGLFTNTTPTYHSVASIEEEQDKMLALEELQQEELLQDELDPDVQLVTFEK